ncbi:MAG: hypothetical protein Q7S84_04530 [bacterium]|nr:hypothetical protein [bacterium]
MKPKELEKPDVIVAFGFSKRGNANRSIAWAASFAAARFGVPVFTQDDVFHAMDLMVKSILAKENGYLSVLGICEQLKELAIQKGWRVVLVKAPPMLRWRCKRDLKKLGFEIFKSSLRAMMETKPKGGWYNPDDPQLWVRGPWIWWAQELPLRMLPWPAYKWMVKKLGAARQASTRKA